MGVLYSQAIDVHSIVFKLGRRENLKDTFPKAKLEYTKDLKEWHNVTDEIYIEPSLIKLSGLNLKDVKVSE